MILEITEIDIKAGRGQEFETAVAACESLFQRAKGWHGLELHRSREITDRYYLLVKWDTVENHTVDFWQSADFQQWRSQVGDFFLSKPVVQHTLLCTCMQKSTLAETASGLHQI